jgi:hypothetical protein
MTSTVVDTAKRPEDFELQRHNPTYNIVVTKNPNVTQKLFYDTLGRSSLSELFANLSDSEKRESLIVSPMRNDNFISFDIDFPKAQAQKYAVLKLLETKELLEYFQVSKKGLEEVIKLRAKIEKSLKGVGGLVDFASNIKPTFYISFGMGDDVREWSGPYVVELIDANITSTSDNIRQLELMFSPTVEGQAVFTNKVFDDTEYAQIRSIFDGVLTGDEKADFTSNEIFDRVLDDKGTRRIARDAIAIRPSLDVGGNGTNFGVRRITKKFLAERFNLPLENVLFLTDADWGFLDKFKPDEEKYQTKLSKYGIKVDTPILPNSKLSQEQRDEKFSELNKTKAKMVKQVAKNNASIQQREKEINQIDYKIIADSEIVNAGFDAGGHGTGTLEGYIRNKYRITPDGRIVKPGDEPVVVNRRSEIIQENNSDLAKSLKKQKQSKEEEIRNKEKKIKIDEEGAIKAGEDQLRISSMSKKIADAYKNNPDATKATPVRDRGKIRFTMSTDTSPSKSHDAQLNVLQPLYDMIKEIKKGSDLTTLSDFTLIEENDHKILRALQQNGLIGSSDSPVVIFGNERIINALVYPGLLDQPKEDLKEDLIFYEMAKIGIPIPLQNSLNRYLYKRGSTIRGATDRGRPVIDIPGLPNLKESGLGYTSKADNIKDAVRILDVKWKEYAQDFRDSMRVRYDGLKTSSFREKPNFYSYGTEVNLELQKLTDPLIFMSNVTNANVESVSFDSSPYKAVLMNAGHDSGYRLVQENVQTSSLVSDNEIFSPSLTKIIDQMAKSFNSTVRDKQPAEFLKELKEGDTRKLVLSIVTQNNNQDEVGGTSVKSLLDFVLLKAGTPPTFKKTVEPGKVGVSDADVLRNMSQYIINVRLKTLPFFNTIMKPGRDCFLFGLSNNVIGSTSLRDIPAPAFFTGAYTIISYKHSISHDSAFSEFELIPNGAGIGTISGDISLLEFFNITQEDIDEELKRKKEEAESAVNAAKAAQTTKDYAQKATNPLQQGAK